MPRIRLVALLLIIFAAIVMPGCPTFPAPDPCVSEIPVGGCPLDGGGTCDDATCSVIYACIEAAWIAQQTCSRPDGGTPTDGGGGSSGDGGPCTPVVVSAKSTGMNCMPDLEDPDCPIDAAGQCVETACLSGCTDFYICGSDDYWAVVAWCDENGDFIVMPQPQP